MAMTEDAFRSLKSDGLEAFGKASREAMHATLTRRCPAASVRTSAPRGTKGDATSTATLFAPVAGSFTKGFDRPTSKSGRHRATRSIDLTEPGGS